MWDKATAKVRERYERMAQEDKERYQKELNFFTTFQIFRMDVKGIPIEEVEFEKKDPVVAFAWQPTGPLFAIIHGRSQKPDVSIYQVRLLDVIFFFVVGLIFAVVLNKGWQNGAQTFEAFGAKTGQQSLLVSRQRFPGISQRQIFSGQSGVFQRSHHGEYHHFRTSQRYGLCLGTSRKILRHRLLCLET